MTRANRLGPLDPIFDVPTSYGGISAGNSPGVPPPVPPSMVYTGFVSDALLLGALWVSASGTVAVVSASDDDRITTVDISDPENPVILDSIQDAAQLFVPQQSCIIGDHVFVAIPGSEARLTSIDISDPSNISISDSLQDSSAFSNAIFVKQFDATHVLVAGNEVALVDISNPAALSVVRIYEPGAESQGGVGAYLGQYAITDRPVGDVLRVVDMTVDPPTVDGSITSSVTMDNPNELVIFSDYAFVCAAGAGSEFIAVVDLTNPTAPAVVAQVDPLGGGVQPWDKVQMYGHYLIFAENASDTLRAIDVTDPTGPIDYADVNVGAESGIIDDLAVAGDLAVMVDSSTDQLFIVELRDFAP